VADPLTSAQIAAIQKRRAKRREPATGVCGACGHRQEVHNGAYFPMASSMAVDMWRCARCGGHLTVTVVCGSNEPSPDEDVGALLAHIEARETERRDLISQAYIASTALRELRTTDEHRAAVFTKMEASLAQHGERIQRLEQALKIAVALIREYYDDHRDPKSDDSDWGQSADNKCNWCLDAERVFALAASSAEPLTGETDAQAEQEKKS
jgi:hypothetical protein